MRDSVDATTGEILRSLRYPFERTRVGIVFELPSRTVNSFKDETDINNIVNRFARSGMLPPNPGGGVFADVTGLQGDLTERVNFSKQVVADASSNDVKLAKHREAKRKSDEVAAADAAKVAASLVPPVNAPLI